MQYYENSKVAIVSRINFAKSVQEFTRLVEPAELYYLWLTVIRILVEIDLCLENKSDLKSDSQNYMTLFNFKQKFINEKIES